MKEIIAWLFFVLCLFGLIGFFYSLFESCNRTTKNNQSYNKKQPIVSKYKGNQLANGVSPYDACFGTGMYDYNKSSQITFKNGQSSDAIVCLISTLTEKTVRNEYIQNGEEFVMTNLPDGEYYIKVFYGNDWNPEKPIPRCNAKGGFDSNVSFSKSDYQNDLISVRDNGSRYTAGEVTLYRVSNGNMSSRPIDENDFFR